MAGLHFTTNAPQRSAGFARRIAIVTSVRVGARASGDRALVRVRVGGRGVPHGTGQVPAPPARLLDSRAAGQDILTAGEERRCHERGSGNTQYLGRQQLQIRNSKIRIRKPFTSEKINIAGLKAKEGVIK